MLITYFIIDTNMDSVNDTKKYLFSRFKMEDLNEVGITFGIKVKKHNEALLRVNLTILRKS